MSNVVKFYSNDAAKDPDAVLEQSIGEYESIVLIGYDKEGFLNARASTNIKAKDVNWLIDAFKAKLINGDYEADEEGK